jgi:hypothetical protein
MNPLYLYWFPEVSFVISFVLSFESFAFNDFDLNTMGHKGCSRYTKDITFMIK